MGVDPSKGITKLGGSNPRVRVYTDLFGRSLFCWKTTTTAAATNEEPPDDHGAHAVSASDG